MHGGMVMKAMPLGVLLIITLGCSSSSTAEALPKVPPGFQVQVFAGGLPLATMMAFSPKGDLYVSLPSEGRVVVLPDEDHDGRADRVITFAEGLELPTGLAFRDGALYVAGGRFLVRLEDTDGDRVADRRRILVSDLPPRGNHWTKGLGFGPDGMLYLSIGSSCNVCIEEDRRRAAILRMRPDGTGMRVFAEGLRNAYRFTWHPETKKMYATEIGRDWLGDDLPPDEVNIIEEGRHYGWPFCYGDRIPDPEWGKPEFCQKTVPPLVKLPAHSSPGGLAFYTGTQFPEEYRGNLFVTLLGSWNRSTPVGYMVVRIPFDGETPGRPVEFMTDFPASGATRVGGPRRAGITVCEECGKPSDLAVGPEGSLYIADRKAGRVYRVTYRPR